MAAARSKKGTFALFERDRVDDALALHDLQTGFEHLPFRRVDHHRHAGDFGLRGHEVQKVAHGLRPVDQTVVHADVDELRSGVDLCAGHGERFVVVAFADETGELRRAGHVGALADVDEVGLGDDAQRFETAQDRDMARCGGDAAARSRPRSSQVRRYVRGVVPQQPPMMSTSPRRMYSAQSAANIAGVSS